MPAALVMATARGMLRAVAQPSDSPGEVLARVNDAMYPEIPPNMFVTRFCAILDPVGYCSPTPATTYPTCGATASAHPTSGQRGCL